MACKYLGQKLEILQELTGGEPQQKRYIPICMLRRRPDEFFGFGWLSKCKEVSESDGCWLWNEQNPNMPDTEFLRKR